MLTSLSKNRFYRHLVSGLWLLVLIGLPLTSFPILSRLTGAIVAPFSAIPLAVLLIVWLVPYLAERGKLPYQVVPFLYFILIALIVSGVAFFLDGFYARERGFFDQSLRAFITVGIGLCFYLIFSAFPLQKNGVRITLLFIYIGGILIIVWTLFEVLMLRRYGIMQNQPEWFLSVRSALAVQSPTVLFTNRVTGFAYEPSWFVRQFNLVLFPIWMSAVFQRKSIFSFHVWKFQVEDLLLLAGLTVFGFSSPRIGLLAFLASLALLGLILLRRLHKQLLKWVLNHRKKPLNRPWGLKLLLGLMIFVVMFTLAASAITGYVLVASRWDERYQLLLRESTRRSLGIFPLTETRLIYMARSLAFFERMIYWFAGWNIFNDYPFGVGLGNAGFYFVDRMHGAAYESLEMRNLVYRANYLPNTKNLWTRLLSETGYIGLAVFLTWLYILWRSAGLTSKSSDPILQILGLAGQLFLLAYLIEGFSMDSFAMPYQWLMTGLISAGGMLTRLELGKSGP